MQRNDRLGFYGAKTRFSTIKKESNILQAFFSKGTFLICRLCGKFSGEFLILNITKLNHQKQNIYEERQPHLYNRPMIPVVFVFCTVKLLK